MRIRSLELYRFRNLTDQTIRFPERVCLIVGDNGQGKTSLLEAIYLLSQAKSFRTSRLQELVRWESGKGSSCRVTAAIDTEVGSKRIAWALEDGSRAVYLHDKRIETASAFYGQLLTVLFTPEELQLVKGAPTLRRSFMDRLLAMVDPQYVEHAVAYQRTLKQRNAVLQAARHGRESSAQRQALLASWDPLLVRHGREIAVRRRQLIAEIAPRFFEHYSFIAGVENAQQAVECRYSSELLHEGEVAGIEAIQQKLQETAERDLAQGTTGSGIHRDELLLYLDTGAGLKPARKTASQGQARSMALALKLAALAFLRHKTGEHPVVLLDDVESELDRRRREALYTLLEQLESQVIITTTEIASGVRERFGSPAVIRLRAGHAEVVDG